MCFVSTVATLPRFWRMIHMSKARGMESVASANVYSNQKSFLCGGRITS